VDKIEDILGTVDANYQNAVSRSVVALPVSVGFAVAFLSIATSPCSQDAHAHIPLPYFALPGQQPFCGTELGMVASAVAAHRSTLAFGPV